LKLFVNDVGSLAVQSWRCITWLSVERGSLLWLQDWLTSR